MKTIFDILKEYNIPATKDVIWEVRPGSKTYAMKHKLIEKLGNLVGVTLQFKIEVIDVEAKQVVIKARGEDTKGRVFESYGEAADYNNKNGYPVAMAEKRAADRVILKFLNVYGDVYGEDESEDFRRK